MANKRLQVVGLALLLAVSFLAGGWFFTRTAGNRAVRHEVESLYTDQGEQWGIFDHIPAEELEAAAQAAAEGLQQEIELPEEKNQPWTDGRQLPSQIAITDVSEIAGIAPTEKQQSQQETEDVKPKGMPVVLNLTGTETTSVVGADRPTEKEQEESKMTMLGLPVKYRLIKQLSQYKQFKQEARGQYPEVDFAKEMVVVLESDSEWPDNAFEIISVQEHKDHLLITYRVNVLGLEKKLNTHSVQKVPKTDLPVELKQVL